VSKEKTMPGRMLFSPSVINLQFKDQFAKHRWKPVRVPCESPPGRVFPAWLQRTVEEQRRVPRDGLREGGARR
jgi:hypothetical protein